MILDNFNMKVFYKIGFILLFIISLASLGLFMQNFDKLSVIENVKSAANLGFNILLTVLFYWLLYNQIKSERLGLGKELTKKEINKYFAEGK